MYGRRKRFGIWKGRIDEIGNGIGEKDDGRIIGWGVSGVNEVGLCREVGMNGV